MPRQRRSVGVDEALADQADTALLKALLDAAFIRRRQRPARPVEKHRVKPAVYCCGTKARYSHG